MTGKDLKELLTKFNMSQTDIAKQLGLSQQSFSQALNAADIKSGLLERIAKALCVPVSRLYGEVGNNIQDSAIALGNGIAVHGGCNAINDASVLEERVKALEALLAEKERIIKLYEKMTKNGQM